LPEPAAETGVNPKRARSPRRFDEAKAHARGVEARKGDDDPHGLAAGEAYGLEDKLELKLKVTASPVEVFKRGEGGLLDLN
jgi:hypothetical protein